MKKHECKFVRATKSVPLHKYITENGEIVKDLITGKDTLKVWYCPSCKMTKAYDLERS